MTLPLAGKKIAITRAPDQAEGLAARLQELGAEPVLLPMLAIEQLIDVSPPNPADYDWIIFTSSNAIPPFLGKKLSKVAAVGTATARALNEAGIQVDLLPDVHTSEALFQAMQAAVSLAGLKILLPGGNLTRPLLVESLRGAGAQVDFVMVYRTMRPSLPESPPPFDMIFFASPSAVRHFMDSFEAPSAVIGSAQVACIGPTTATAAQECGLTVHLIAQPHSIAGFIETLVKEMKT
jgi:uroporphyrinogen-III synthase